MMVHQVPADIPLFLLKKGTPKEFKEGRTPDKGDSQGVPQKEQRPGEDVREASQLAACHQAIASTSAFTLAMFSPMAPIMKENGLHHYRNIHWEAGLIGHILYLEGTVPFQSLCLDCQPSLTLCNSRSVRLGRHRHGLFPR